MKIVLHYPTTEAGMQSLAEKFATIQASYVVDRLKALNCPKEQKLELLKAIVAESEGMEKLEVRG